MVAVAEVQLGEQRQAADEEAQRRVGDVQAGQSQLLHIAQLALVVQLTCGSGEGVANGLKRQRARARGASRAPLIPG